MIEDNLLVDARAERSPIQQIRHGHLEFAAALPDQLAYQAVGAGVGPVGGELSVFQVVKDGPGIINIPFFPKCKAVIPSFYIILFVGHSVLVQCGEYLLLCKAEAVSICFGSGCHYGQIVQIRKNRFLADSRNPRHDGPLQERVRLEGGIEEGPHEVHYLLPVSGHISLLHGSVIFIQQYDCLFPIIAGEIVGQGPQGTGGHIVFHIRGHLSVGGPLAFIEAAALQEEVIFIVQIRDGLAHHLPGIREQPCLNIGKAQGDDWIGALELMVLTIPFQGICPFRGIFSWNRICPIGGFILPDGQPFEQMSFVRKVHREEMLHHAHVQGLAEAPGAGD